MVQIANNPLFIEDLSASNNEVKRGSTATRRITVKNLGDKRAEIDIWIAATDEKSEPLLRWCTFSEQNPLYLESKESREVTLNFEVPQQATPDLYNYEILIEAPAQYPDKIIRRPQQLRVVLSEQDGEWGSEPGFTLQPVTTSANPYLLKAGEQLEVKVKVENRSKRVDRFYLICPDLDKEWFSIHYPESSLEMSGLVKETDGLELNPGSTGEISLRLHPPRHTLTGNYFPTIRLISTNKEDLVLLDVVYLQILPDDSLNVELHPLVRKVPREVGEFEVELSNQGNINRELTILAADGEGVFTYTPEPPLVRLLPGDTSTVALKVKPSQWWRRPFRGTALEIDFDVEVENTNQLLLPETSKPPALPKDLPRGTVVWESRPLWLLWLLIALALGTIGAIAFYIWWQFFKPLPFPPSPKVLEFDNTIDDSTKKKKVYQESYGDAVRLDWRISDLSRIDKVTVIRLEQNVETDRKSYIFQGNIPKHLLPENNQKNNFCQKLNEAKGNDDILSCKGIITSAKKPGNYTFKIQVFSKQNQKEPSDTQTTDTITINPVTPLPAPKVIDLSSTKPIYEEVSVGSLQLSSSSTQLPAPALPSSSPTPGPILLNWEISSPNHLKELRIVGLAPDGSINSELKRYEIKNKILPPELRIYCEPKENLSGEKNLVCRNVPTDARKPGDYIFKLAVISPGQQEPAESKQTATIKIQPLPSPKVTDFSSSEPVYQEVSAETLKANGQNGLIRLNWEIANASQIKELKVAGLAPDGSINSQSKQYIIINNSLPPELKSFCSLTTKLICRGVPTDARKPGDYTFKLAVISQGQQEPTDSKQTANIKIQPLPLPKVADFSSTKPVYEEVSAETLRANGQNVSSNTTETTAPGSSSRPPAGPIRLNWEIDNASQIKELKVVGLAPDGTINSQLKRYPVINNSLPTQLKGFCVLATKLICQNVPTDAVQAGDYTFKLTVVPKQGQDAPEITKNTANIKIKPQPPKPPKPPTPPTPATPVNIISFKINNQEVSQKPKYSYAINKDRGSVDIVLTWQVQNGEDIKVELLPSPGAVSSQGSLNYTLSKPPSSETITLKVTNKAGEQKTQSVVIETVEPNKSVQPQKSSSGGASPGAPSPAGAAPGGASPGAPSPAGASPSPANPGGLSPIELPPRPD